MTYFDELTKAMTWLGNKPDTLFIGQSVAYPSNAIYKTLDGVPMVKRLELPVAEEMQMGISIGMAMMGKTVISIFPRMDFLMCAMNQLVNHLDKNIYLMKGKVIIRTCVGATKPLYPGVQHCGDYTEGINKLLKNIPMYKLLSAEQVSFYYSEVYKSGKSALIVEYGDSYND